MNARIIINRADPKKPLKPGDKFWAQIEVSGRQPAKFGDERILLDVDEVARRSIVSRFESMSNDPGFAGLLVDADHLSHDMAHKTEALSWLYEVEERDGELWGYLELTGAGAPAIANKDYQWFSTEFDEQSIERIGRDEESGLDIYRPLALDGLAYTNRPQRKGGKSISNRRQAGSETQEPTQDNDDMKNIATKLGLSEDATEEDILAAIGSLQEEVDAGKTKEAEAEADAIMNRFGDRVPEAARDGWRSALIANREQAEAMMTASFPEPPAAPEKEKEPATGRKPLFNRSDAKTPPPVESEGAEANRAAEAVTLKRAAAIRNRAAEIRKSLGLSFDAAFARARAELAD